MKILLDIQEKYKEIELHICSHEKSNECLQIKELLEELFVNKLTVYENQEVRQIKLIDIVRIYTESKRVYVRSDHHHFEIKERLYALEESLKEQGFVRISNSEIVNISKIEKLDMSYIGTIKMYLKNGDITYVSRRYVSKIKEVLMKED